MEELGIVVDSESKEEEEEVVVDGVMTDVEVELIAKVRAHLTTIYLYKLLTYCS